MLSLGILGSTRGTNLRALIDAINQNQLLAKINIVISNKSDAGILSIAQNNFIPACFVNPQDLSRSDFDANVSNLLKEYEVDLIVLIGYMRILAKEFVATWREKIINIHPSLLPAYAAMMDLDVHRAVLAAHEKVSGCSVHYVTDVVDAGPIILQKKCAVFPDDTPERLKARVQALESQALIEAINQIAHQNSYLD